jgi:RNA polymerase sigma-70 factor (ECF subfamily)
MQTCMPFFVRQVLGSPGDWPMVATQANGQPAVVGYQLSSDGVHRVYAIAVLAVTGGGIARITTFGDPRSIARFGAPTALQLR